MGYWENTTYINHGDSSHVANQLVKLFTAEGMQPILRPKQREKLWYEPMQYNSALENNTWGVAVFPDAENWTVIKTAPQELLGERPPGKKTMRLVKLCASLKASGFQINLYDGCQTILIEANGLGDYRLSGFGRGDTHNPDPLQFYGGYLKEEALEIRFELLPLQKHIENSKHSDPNSGFYINGESFVRHLAKDLGGLNAEFCQNQTSVDTLVCHKPFLAKGGIELYLFWPPDDRPEPPRRTLEEYQQATGNQTGAS